MLLCCGTKINHYKTVEYYYLWVELYRGDPTADTLSRQQRRLTSIIIEQYYRRYGIFVHVIGNLVLGFMKY